MSKIVTGHAFGYQEMPTELSPPPENRLSAVEYFRGYSYSVDKKEVPVFERPQHLYIPCISAIYTIE